MKSGRQCVISASTKDLWNIPITTVERVPVPTTREASDCDKESEIGLVGTSTRRGLGPDWRYSRWHERPVQGRASLCSHRLIHAPPVPWSHSWRHDDTVRPLFPNNLIDCVELLDGGSPLLSYSRQHAESAQNFRSLSEMCVLRPQLMLSVCAACQLSS